ncbi:MAG: YhcN/YlaJ family sporulation lipoprotein [Bacillaceae bacterium]|nr:YhcN/YlaJ family sporulation lipoprotein [Bacillaceae bacterium]
MRKKGLLITVLIMAVTLMSACNQMGTGEREYGTRDFQDRDSADTEMNTVVDRDLENRQGPDRVNQYGNDTITREVNPNMVTGRNTDLFNIYAESGRMTARARQVEGVRNATVIINGGNAYVALELDPNLNPSQRTETEMEVRRQLQYMMPRYNVRVTSENQFLNRVRNLMDTFQTRQ